MDFCSTIDSSYILFAKPSRSWFTNGKHIIRKLDDEVNFLHKTQRVNNTDFMSQETSTKMPMIFMSNSQSVKAWCLFIFSCQQTLPNRIVYIYSYTNIYVGLSFYLLFVFIYLIFIHSDTLLRFTYNHFYRHFSLWIWGIFDLILSHVLCKYSIYFGNGWGKIIKCNAYKWNQMFFIIACAILITACFIDISFDCCQICFPK